MSPVAVIVELLVIALCVRGAWWAWSWTPDTEEPLPGASCFGAWSEDDEDLHFNFPGRA